MTPLAALALLSLTLAALATAAALNARQALHLALRDRAEELASLNNRILRIERRAAARAFHAGHRDEAVEIAPPVVRQRPNAGPWGRGR